MTTAAAKHEPASAAAQRAWIDPVFGALLSLSILKGIRMPNLWSMTHYLFAYRAGFVKRALWGEILFDVFGRATASYFVLAAIAFAVFLAFMGIVSRASWRLAPTSSTVRFLVVFAASPALALSAHLVGYLEQVAYLGVMLGVMLRRRWQVQTTWFVLMAGLLPFVHEASIVWVGSLAALAIVAGAAPPSKRAIALLLVGIAWCASTATVLRFGTAPHERIEVLRVQRAHVDFQVRPDAFTTLEATLSQRIREMRGWWDDANHRVELFFSLLVFAPAALVLGGIALQRARILEGDRFRRLAAMLFAVGSIVAPLTLHAIAADVHRWNTLAALNAGLAALILAQAAPATEGGHSVRGLALALIVAVWSVSADPFYLDGYGPAHPPFVSKILFFVKAMRKPDRALWIPSL